MSRRVTLNLGYEGNLRDVTVVIPDDEPTPWQWGDKLEIVGHPTPRIDGPLKATGTAKYTYDIQLPGMLYGAILRSPLPHARIKSIDTARAARLRGVRAIINIDDDVVRFAGQEVAAVAAISSYIANDALALIKVDYEPLPFVADLDAAMAAGAPAVFENGSNLGGAKDSSHGDAAQGFAHAETVHQATYSTQVQTHVSLEVHGSGASWDGDKLTVWTSTQDS